MKPAAAVAWLFVAACTAVPLPSGPYACVADAGDCAAGFVCVGGICLAAELNGATSGTTTGVSTTGSLASTSTGSGTTSGNAAGMTSGHAGTTAVAATGPTATSAGSSSGVNGGNSGTGSGTGGPTSGGTSGATGFAFTELSLLSGQVGTPGGLAGTGDEALFSGVSQAVPNGAGLLYLTDYTDDLIRVMDLATGVVTTLAGQVGVAVDADSDTGAGATFAAPSWLTYDGSTYLYVVDGSSSTIRQVSVATGATTTVAGIEGGGDCVLGNGRAAGFNGLGGLAHDGNHTLYVADTFCFSILAFDTNTWDETVIAGDNGGSTCQYMDGTASMALFSYAGAIAYSNGHLYTIDSGAPFCGSVGDTLRDIDLTTMTVSTIAGAPGQAGSADGIGSAASFHQPGPIAADGQGNLFVGDGLNETVRQIVLATQEVTTIAGQVGVTGTNDGVGTAALMGSLNGISADGQGHVFIADGTDQVIREMLLDSGIVNTLIGQDGVAGSVDSNQGTGQLNQPNGLAYDGQGNLYVADLGDKTIRRIDAKTGAVTTVAGQSGGDGGSDGQGIDAGFGGPAALAFVDVDAGYLYIDDNGLSIRQLELDNAKVTTVAGNSMMGGDVLGTGTAALFNAIGQLTYDGEGSLIVPDTFNFKFKKVTIQTGVVSAFAGSGAFCTCNDGAIAAAGFCYAGQIMSVGGGIYYVTDSGAPFNNTCGSLIRKIDTNSGMVSTVAGQPGVKQDLDGLGTAALLDEPAQMTFDGDHLLYFTESAGGGLVRQYDLLSTAVKTIVGVPGTSSVLLGPLPGGLDVPASLALGPGPTLFIADQQAHAVFEAR